jgi:hypothetical protein
MRANRVNDFHFFYTLGKIFRDGNNIYDRNLFAEEYLRITGEFPVVSPINAYPPHAVAAFSIFTTLSPAYASSIYHLINAISTVGSIVIFMLIILQSQRLSIFTIMIGVLSLNLSGVRSNLVIDQLGAITTSMINLVFLLAILRKDVVSGAILGLLSFKPSFPPLFLLYIICIRRLRIFASCVVTIAAAVGATLFLMPTRPDQIIADWLHETIALNASFEQCNYALPQTATYIHLIPLVCRIMSADNVGTSIIGYFVCIVVVVTSFYIILRSRYPLEPRNIAIISLVSSLVTYHRNYDIFLVIPSLLVISQYTMIANHRRKWMLFILASVVVLTIPTDLSVRMTNLVPDLNSSYLFRVLAPFQTWLSLILWCLICRASLHAERAARDDAAA